jgi:MerR family mercuric resistance operon transcriptional regulator
MSHLGTPIKIGTLSRRTHCNIETIRYYERIGLLPAPPRMQGGYRLYSLEHVKRLNFIRRARGLGFTLDEVRALLKLADDRGRTCGEARALASAHLEEVRAKVAALKTMERVLKELIAHCDAGKLPECPLIESLFQEAPESGGPDDATN